MYKHGDVVVLLSDFDKTYRAGMMAIVDDYGLALDDDELFILKPSRNDTDVFLFPALFIRHATDTERFLYEINGRNALING
jgi:hypothetical protein